MREPSLHSLGVHRRVRPNEAATSFFSPIRRGPGTSRKKAEIAVTVCTNQISETRLQGGSDGRLREKESRSERLRVIRVINDSFGLLFFCVRALPEERIRVCLSGLLTIRQTGERIQTRPDLPACLPALLVVLPTFIQKNKRRLPQCSGP